MTKRKEGLSTYERGCVGENLVEAKLNQLGYDASQTPPNALYDIDVITHVGNAIRVEVKTSTLKNDASGTYFKFQFSQPLSRRGKGHHMNGTRAMKTTRHYDAVVLVALDTDSTYYFVLPPSAVAGKKCIRINQATKNGKYLRYLNAFHYIDRKEQTK